MRMGRVNKVGGRREENGRMGRNREGENKDSDKTKVYKRYKVKP